MRNGIVLADKPPGMGSTHLVGALRHRLRETYGKIRVGHTGTLDRFASGLMLLPVGRATALAEVFLHADKRYEAWFSFGRFTDTHDPTGRTVQEVSHEAAREFVAAEKPRITEELQRFSLVSRQRPPAFSALKTEGERYSDRARRTGVAEMPRERSVRIYDIGVDGFDEQAARVRVSLSVSGGTYVRAIARDLSELLEFPIHLSELRRTAIGRITLDVDDIWKAPDGPIRMRSLSGALPEWPQVSVEPGQVALIQQGRRVTLRGPLPDPGRDFFLIRGSDGEAVAWAKSQVGGYSYQRVFV